MTMDPNNPNVLLMLPVGKEPGAHGILLIGYGNRYLQISDSGKTWEY
jgi:hypothetical protein